MSGDHTTDIMLEALRGLMGSEPTEPDPEVLVGAAYQEAAEAHYQWQRSVNAYRLLLGIRLVNQALDDPEPEVP